MPPSNFYSGYSRRQLLRLAGLAAGSTALSISLVLDELVKPWPIKFALSLQPNSWQT